MPLAEPDRGAPTATPLNVEYRISRVAQYLRGDWLDFGCADGGYAAKLLERGASSITGVDVEADRVEDARSRKLEKATFLPFDGTTLPFDDASFDGVWMNEVFEHVADEAAVLQEIRRVLRPGGRLILISPNRWFPIEGHEVNIGSKVFGPAPIIPWLPERMTRSWTVARNYWPRQLVRHVRTAGFAIEKCDFIWPVLEMYQWLPPKALTAYHRNFRRWDQKRAVRRFGVSTMVIGIRPAHEPELGQNALQRK